MLGIRLTAAGAFMVCTLANGNKRRGFGAVSPEGFRAAWETVPRLAILVGSAAAGITP